MVKLRVNNIFLEKYPNLQVSARTYTDVFKITFNLRFRVFRYDIYGYCDKLYTKLCAADNEDEKQHIAIESQIHLMKADAGYKTLKIDAEVTNKKSNVICSIVYRFVTL